MWHHDNLKDRCRIGNRRGRGRSFHVLVLSGYALLTILLTYPLVLHLTTHIPSYPADPGVGDPWVNMWAFGFIHRVVTEAKHWSLFTDTIFYPRGVDLTIPLVFGVGLPLLASIPFVHFFGIILSYNLFIIGAFVLNAYVTFLLVRYLTQDNRAAWISGMAFAFFPYHMVRSLAHLNILASGFWIPLYILLFVKAIRDRRFADIMFVSLTFTFAVIANLYYAFYLAVFTICYMLYHLWSESELALKSQLLKRLLSIGWITSLFFLPIVWWLLVHSWEDFHVAIPRAMSFNFGADLLAFFLPSSFHALWGDLVKPFYYYHFTGGISEQTVYLGYIVMILAIIAVIKVPSPETRFWALSAVVFFVLALGAFLHIYGTPIGIPLPYWLLLFIPPINTLRGASRSVIMVMMALSVLAGYGTKYILQRFDGRWGISLIILGGMMTSIALEFLTMPLPLADARVPKVYQKIAAQNQTGGTLLDLPLHRLLTKYEYYQTTHGKRILLGQAPRISVELLTTYADSVPLMKLFKNPDLIQEYEEKPIDQRDVLQFIEFFDLSFIVIHKDLLGAEMFDQFDYFPRSPTRLQASEMAERLVRFFLTHFPVAHVEAEDDLVSLELDRKDQNTDRSVAREGYLVDFQSKTSPGFLAEGWGATEHDGEVTFAWSNGKASQLWIRVPQPEDYVMELRLSWILPPGNPQQAVAVYVNRHLVTEVLLEADGWQRYTVDIPKASLTSGPNSLRFVYRYTTSPAEIYPGSTDTRRLAVAFDFIKLRARGDGS